MSKKKNHNDHVTCRAGSIEDSKQYTGSKSENSTR